MTLMEWKEVKPEQFDWKKQIDVMAYYGSHKIGSIVLCDNGWNYVVDDSMGFLEAKTEDDAKKEMIEWLCEYFEREIDYYRELIVGLEKLS